MVNTCSALNCKNGVGNVVEARTTFHRFPLRNQQLLRTWLSRMSRKDFSPNDHSRICSKHFTDDDFITDSCDSNKRRKKIRTDSSLLRRRLKPDSVPSIFVGLPSYSFNFDNHSQKEHGHGLENMISNPNEFTEKEEKIGSLEEMLEGISSCPVIPAGFTVIKQTASEVTILFAIIEMNDIPRFKASLKVFADMNFAVYVDNQLVSFMKYYHLMKNHQIQSIRDLLTLLAFVKSTVGAD